MDLYSVDTYQPTRRSPYTLATSADAASIVPNGTLVAMSARLVAMSTTPTTPPIIDASTNTRTTSFRPRNAPTMASILTSPKPIASTLRRRNHASAIAHSSPPPARMPTSDMSGPGGRNQLHAKPATMPGSVITSGSSWCSSSMAKRTMSAAANTTRTANSGVGPNTIQCQRTIDAVTISTTG